MTKQELIELAKKGRVDFKGNVVVTSIWNGICMLAYFAQYADETGIHACPDEDIYCVDDYDPIPFDDEELTDEVYGELVADIA